MKNTSNDLFFSTQFGMKVTFEFPLSGVCNVFCEMCPLWCRRFHSVFTGLGSVYLKL